MDRTEFTSYLNQLSKLSYSQLKKLRQQVESQISADEAGKAIADREDAVAACPHCDSPEFSKWGQTEQERQRYRCKGCGKTFSTLTGTALYRLRKAEKWGEYTQELGVSHPLRKAAKHLGINLKTAFRWRHRFLRNPCEHKPSELAGIIEADEAFINESFKGSRQMPRKPRKRGGGKVAKIPMLLALDRNGAISHHVLAADTKDELSKALSPLLTADSVLCTDGNLSYRTIVQELEFDIEHKRLIRLDNQYVIDGVYHIQTLNNYIKRWRAWLSRFCGVGTAYLDHYLAWFRFMEEQKRSGSKNWLKEAANS